MAHQLFTTVPAEKNSFCLSWFAIGRGQLLGHSNQPPGSRRADTGPRPRCLYETAHGDNPGSSPDGCLVEPRLLSIEGAAANGIISFAQTAPGAGIVMPTHVRSGVQRWILGSVTEKIVRHADDRFWWYGMNESNRGLGIGAAQSRSLPFISPAGHAAVCLAHDTSPCA